MTFDTRGRPIASAATDPPAAEQQQQQTQSQQQQQPGDGGGSSSSEQTELSPEELIASFPVVKLSALNIKISSPRWVVPVMPDQELECLLNAAIKLSELGVDHEFEPCMHFYRDELTTSFIKILTDEAVNSWKYNIHYCILMSCGKLLHLAALHMKRDNMYLLDLLSMVLDPDNKFHTHNASRQPELHLTPGPSGAAPVWGALDESQIFARTPPEPRSPRGWLVDLINRFGQAGGFDGLLERFQIGMAAMKKSVEEAALITSTASLSLTDSTATTTADSSSKKPTPAPLSAITVAPAPSTSSSTSASMTEEPNNKLTLPLIHALLRPFGQCAELLTIPTIEKYFAPIWEFVLELMQNLSDDELKREAKLEGKNDTINGIVKSARFLINRIPNQETLLKDFEMCRLKIILRVLQISSFNGKMNALNEINKMLGLVSYYPHRPQTPEDDVDFLTAERIAKWIKETDVLGIVLRDSLHQPQYVEKIEKILRFLIKEKALTLDDLDAVWRAQEGKHEAIVKNVHDLLAKLAWDFNSIQLDHLFECFQASMRTANKKQRERLLELNRRLAEDDKNGVMANKVLELFWTLAHSSDIPPEVLDQALASHVKILDYSCSQERDNQKTQWLDKCVAELKSSTNDWVLPALRLIREICCLYEASQTHAPRVHPTLNRQQVIDRLQNEHTLVILVTTSLTTYMERVRTLLAGYPGLRPMDLMLDKRYPHPQQIAERLDFLKFLLKDGQLWLCADQAKQIWQCLAVNAAFPSDREECFRWFGKLMGDEPDLDPGINKDFFENNLLQLDPTLLTESGIKCFERFFKAVNSKEEKLKAKHRGYVLDDEDLIGKDYLWRVITMSGEDIAYKAIELLKEVSTALGPRLQVDISKFHENFIRECCDRLKTHMDNIVLFSKIIDDTDDAKENCREVVTQRMVEADKMCRVVRVLQEYNKECDRVYTGERYLLPLNRASRGKHVVLYIRFQNPGRPLDDIEMTTHSNEMVISFKRNLLKRLKGTSINSIKIDLYNSNGELIEIADDRHPLSQYNIRDKTLLTAKLTPIGAGMASSPDSSSDSSTGSPPRPCSDIIRPESEGTLPGVYISGKPEYTEFFLRIYQMGSELQHASLRECTRALLHLLPLDRFTIRKINAMCTAFMAPELGDKTNAFTPEALFLSATPAQVLYNLEVLHAMLIPAYDPHGEATLHLQSAWLHSGVAHFILELLTKNNFLPSADMHTKRAAFQCVLKLVKLFLFIVGFVLSRVGNEPVPSTAAAADGVRSQVEILKQALTTIPGSSEFTLRTIVTMLAQNLAKELLAGGDEGDRCRSLFGSALQWSLPDTATIKATVHLAWALAVGGLVRLQGESDALAATANAIPDAQDIVVCKEALEVLSISLVLNPNANEALTRDPDWPKFITALLIMNPSRHIRQAVAEQLLVSCTYCAADRRPFVFLAKLLVDALPTLISQHPATCAEFFQLLCRVINYGCLYSWSLSSNEALLTQEMAWLTEVCDAVKRTGETQVHEDLLEGHLCLAKELLIVHSPEVKAQLNALISDFIDDYLFPASRHYLHLRRTGNLRDHSRPPPVCRTSHTIAAACDLLVALCQNSVPNMKLLVNMLIDMFCSDTEPLREWEYLPPVGPRPSKGFVGLKNAGATCYMNSVLQQLYMVPTIRVGILRATGAVTDPNEDFSGEVDQTSVIEANRDEGNNRSKYHIGILKHVQAIFAHLGHSALQFYVPRGLWSHFKLQGEPVNLREQQDAVEFFMSLFESLDEGLKALGHQQLMGATLGGCFSDQKICKGCPHRYSKDEPFSVFSVDIRNHSSLTDSLEQYVKGELLEGADAYHCDKCDKKVVTVKRLCVKKLPPVLAIQLKRFEYDYERVCAIKFNDYFEFPRWLDMEPYTVSGLAKLEGEVIDVEDNMDDQPATTKYQLTGIVVHSGQASGGHYFSFILHKNQNGEEQWYKFDDGEVSECKMHEDDEMKAQCFGGDYMGEVYDNNLKRMQYRRQKRWWNAYMLFYTRCDQQPIQFKPSIEQLSLAESRNCVLPMPEPIERSVRTQNIRFLHARSLFSAEFFTFIRKLVSCTVPQTRADKLTPTAEELSLLGIQLASQFLFHSGFRTKKTLRGAAIDWYEALKIPVLTWYDVLCQHIRHSPAVRTWFAENVLLNPPSRLAEYILIAPSPEVRTVFVKLVVFFCHFAINDDPLPNIEGSNLCEQVLMAVLVLLKSEVAEHGKHLPHYFSLFSMYAGLGIQEKHQLLKLNVPALFMQVALDEGPGPSIKYQYPDMSKLHGVVSHLIRCSDISPRCQSSTPGGTVKPNIFVHLNAPLDNMPTLSPEAQELLFNRSSYIKKLIEDTNVGEDGLKLLQYCSWENPHFSRSLLTELLWHCGFAYWHDMRHHTELLLNILLIEDSWQHRRIHNALMGVSEERESLLDTIHRNKNNYQKRAYQCIKCMVQLFTRSQVALQMLHSNQMLARHWTSAVEWLQDELERQRGIGGQYTYSSWSPPAQSNENTNSFILERSQSAKNVLRKACELCPEEETEEPNDSEADPADETQNTLNETQEGDKPAVTASTSASTAETSQSEPPSTGISIITFHSGDVGSSQVRSNIPPKADETYRRLLGLEPFGPKVIGSISKNSLSQLSLSGPNVSPEAKNDSTTTTTATTLANPSMEQRTSPTAAVTVTTNPLTTSSSPPPPPSPATSNQVTSSGGVDKT